VALIASAVAAIGAHAVQMPSFHAPNDFGIERRLKALAAKAGPDWREVAEKNRTTGLEKLWGAYLENALSETTRKYVDPDTQSVGNVPLSELGEIAEAAFRGGLRTGGYGWALWHNFMTSNDRVDDSVTAAKLLAGFDRGLAGVVPKDAAGERIVFSPQWSLASFQTGLYRTSLPGGGYFESSWSNSMGCCTYELRTSAKMVSCRIRFSSGCVPYSVDANGEEVDFSGNAFDIEPDKDGIARISIGYIWAGGPRKNRKNGKGAK